jgi:hypothetical protein
MSFAGFGLAYESFHRSLIPFQVWYQYKPSLGIFVQMNYSFGFFDSVEDIVYPVISPCTIPGPYDMRDAVEGLGRHHELERGRGRGEWSG